MDQGSQKDGGKPEEHISLLEWVSAAIGLLITLALLGVVGWQAYNQSGDVPPAVEVRVDRIVPVASGYVVELTASNRSPTTASNIEIEGELTESGRPVATSRASLDYVPGRSERRGGLFFDRDPRAYQLDVRALGYATP